MNRLLIILSVVTLSCGNTISKTTSEPDITKNEETDVQSDILLGEIDKEDLQKNPFATWFEPRYKSFVPDEDSMKKIKENIGEYEIKLLMGTWCGDSRRQVPEFLKLLDKANYNYSKLEMVAVDYNKNTPSKIEKKLDVHHVPTIIFYKNGKEINRFVEYPQEESIEGDIAKIVSGESYKNSYAD